MSTKVEELLNLIETTVKNRKNLEKAYKIYKAEKSGSYDDVQYVNTLIQHDDMFLYDLVQELTRETYYRSVEDAFAMSKNKRSRC